MATELTKKELTHFSITKYEMIRNELKTGDLVFCSGNYFFSRTIQRFTKSVWSHIGIIYRDETLGRVLILESETGVGVRLAPLSKYVHDYHGKNKPYHGNIMIGRINPIPIDENVHKAISFGLDELTKPYDNWEIIRIAIRIMFKITRRVNDRKYICSELVQECYRKGDVSFPFHNTIISPDDIWKDKKVELLYRIL